MEAQRPDRRLSGALLLLFLRTAAVVLILGLQRLLFLLFNTEHFPETPFTAFLGGLRFDLTATCWLLLPWYLLFLIAPFAKGFLARIQEFTFVLGPAIGFFFNVVDIGYFGFTLKRSTADLLTIMTAGQDTLTLAPDFLRDYWYLLLFYVLSIGSLWWAYRISSRWVKPGGPGAIRAVTWRAVALAALALMWRGGTQLIPLQVLNASAYAPPAYIPLVLNSPFTMIASLGKPVLEERNYMSPLEAEMLWPVTHHFQDSAAVRIPPGRPNVVLVVLESFSATYSERLTGIPGHMPFLDSLMTHALTFSRAYANGRRSIDAIPAILASIPELMDEAFITSTYADIPFTSMAGLMKDMGYSTSFFHGGNNGTMGFDTFCASAGFERYVGRDDHPDPQDDDGSWGIRDRPFLQFFADELNKEPTPFFSTVFTLSSHHPYELAPADAERFAGGSLPIHPTLRYTDDALRQFFKRAVKQAWYSNTLFIITADHTADIERTGQQYGKAIDFWIPLAFYMPGHITAQRSDRVTQQIDILPTVMDLLGYREPFFSFGHSALRSNSPPYAVAASNGIYTMIGERHLLRHDGERTVAFEVLFGDGDGANNEPGELIRFDMEARTKAVIQQFNGHMLRRELRIGPDAP
ncbi:MAG: LTA synthase family protein [Flavobacteriales bacterium]|nr:LTA synthase family protein [Flavobacteriales bacterium]